MAPVEGLIAGPLARSLERGRERYNALFRRTRRSSRRLDPGRFSEFMRRSLDPVVRSAAEANPDRVDLVVDSLYSLSLDLVAKEFLGPGSRFPLIDEAWERLLPRLGVHLAAEPRKTAAAVTNAVYQISGEAGASPHRWIDLMIEVGPQCADSGQLMNAGCAAAWISGLAHYRKGALEAIESLPESIVRGLLDFPEEASIQDLRDTLKDPWRSPQTAGQEVRPNLALAGRVGAFRGFGGLFLSPPGITAYQDNLYVWDSESCWILYADRFGTTFRRHAAGPPSLSAQGKGPFTLKVDGTVESGDMRRSFPVLGGFSKWACSSSTLAVTLPHSHRIYLVAGLKERAG